MTKKAKNGVQSGPLISGALHISCTDFEGRYDALLNEPDVPTDLKNVFLMHKRELQKRFESIRGEWWRKSLLTRIRRVGDDHQKRCRHELKQLIESQSVLENDQALLKNAKIPPCPYRIIIEANSPARLSGASWFQCTHGSWGGDCGYGHAGGCWMCTFFTEHHDLTKTHCSLHLNCPGASILGAALWLSTCPAYIPAQALTLIKPEEFSLLNQH